MATKPQPTKVRCRTIGDAAAYTVKHKWTGLSSLKTNLINVDHGLAFCGRSLPLSRMAEAWWWDELTCFLKEEHPRWAPATRNRVRSALKTCVNYTRGRRLHTVKVPEEALREEELGERHAYFTRDQVQEMARVATNYLDDPPLAWAIRFAPSVGLRQSDQLKLKARDIDFDAHCIWVGGKPDVVTKNKTYRAVPIAPEIEHLCHQLKNDAPSEMTRVFGQYWDNGDQLRRQFRKVTNFLELNPKEYCWHTFRHTFATWLGESQTPRTIMDLGGWKDITMVQRYTHPSEKAKHAAMQGLWQPSDAPKSVSTQGVIRLEGGKIVVDGKVYTIAA